VINPADKMPKDEDKIAKAANLVSESIFVNYIYKLALKAKIQNEREKARTVIAKYIN